MSNVRMWMVVCNQDDLRGGKVKYAIHDFAQDAVSAAQRLADTTRMPHDVYTVELIGSASVPQATFDYRVTAMPAAPETPGEPK